MDFLSLILDQSEITKTSLCLSRLHQLQNVTYSWGHQWWLGHFPNLPYKVITPEILTRYREMSTILRKVESENVYCKIVKVPICILFIQFINVLLLCFELERAHFHLLQGWVINLSHGNEKACVRHIKKYKAHYKCVASYDEKRTRFLQCARS